MSIQSIEHAVVAPLPQLIVIILFARAAGSVARAVRQPRAGYRLDKLIEA